MIHEPPPNDPKAVWKHLTTGPRISSQEVRVKAQRLDIRMWRNTIIISVVVPIVDLVVVMRLRSLALPAGIIYAFVAGTCIGIAGYLYSQYRAHGRVWSRVLSADAGVRTSVDFYRGELERQYENYSRQARLAPLFSLIGLPFLVVVAIRRLAGLFTFVIPFCVVLAACSGLMLHHAKRERQRYRRALDELSLFKDVEHGSGN